MLENDDMSLALRTAAHVQDRDVPRIPAAVAADLARAIIDSPAEPAEAAVASQQAAVVRWSRRHRLVLAAALVGAAALTVTLLQTIGSAAPMAFADWTPVPQILTGSAAQQQLDKCPYLLAGTLPRRIPVGVQNVVEQRGRMVSVVYASGNGLGYCMLLDGNGDGGGAMSSAPQPSGSKVVSDGGGSSFTFDGSGARVDTTDIIGRAGPDVASILIHRTDGVIVTAAVYDGLWEAWWPEKAAAATLTVQTTDGRSYEESVAATTPFS